MSISGNMDRYRHTTKNVEVYRYGKMYGYENMYRNRNIFLYLDMLFLYVDIYAHSVLST